MAQTLDFDTLIRSALDARNATVRQRTVLELGFATACYLSKRGVVITLDGQPFEPGNLSIHRAMRLITERGLLEEEGPV